MIYKYTYYFPNGDISNSIFKSNSPGNALRKIVSKILKTEQCKKNIVLKIRVLNVDKTKSYYYNISCVYDPYLKAINKTKTIKVNFKLNIIKINQLIYNE